MKVYEIVEALQHAKPNFEVHIIDTNGDEYPEIITIDTDEAKNVYIVVKSI